VKYLLALVLLLVSGTAQAQLKAPTALYWGYLNEYYDGAFRGSLADFLNEAQTGSIKAGAVRWIDSICYHTMAGDSYYQLGKYGPALDQYTIALNLYVQHADWMIRVQFKPTVAPNVAGNAVAAVPWGASKRVFQVGQYDEYTMSTQGQLNQMSVLQRGGVVQNPMLVPVCIHEVVRCTCQAMRRRRDILGPIAPFDPLINQVLEVCSRRQGQPNHWSECYVDLQLAMAFSAAGKDPQAKVAFERSLVAGGQFDHPLTAMAMVELARIALSQADFQTAERWYEEATYAAVNFDDWGALEDAFRYGMMTHLMANRKGLYPPLVAATEWARRNGLGYLQVSLLQLCAENATALGQPKAATDFIAKARMLIGRGDVAISRLGARVNYTGAIASYQHGIAAAGDTSLASAMTFQRDGSLWLFQIALVDSLLKNQGSITPRVAMDLYTTLLRDPLSADWLTEPIEALSVLSVQHTASYESWFEVAIARKEYERALEIADLTRRHRFLSALEFGGRLLNLRWLLEGPEELLDQRARLQKQDLLTRFVGYDQLSQQAQRMYDDLRREPLWFNDAADAKEQAERLAELAKVCQQQEVILREIALRREPADIIFPPIRTTKQVQEVMTDGRALLAFFCTNRQTHCFLMTNDKYGYWMISSPTTVEREVKNFLRDMGNWEQNKQLRANDLADNTWKKQGREVLDLLMRDSKVSLPYTFTELVIVPDNLLWYVPFEALQVVDGNSTVSLASKLKLRYAPTVGLGIADNRPRKQGGNTAVVLGRLFPQDDDEVAVAAYQDMEHALVNPTAIHGHMHAPSGMIASLADRLVVLGDIIPGTTNNPFDWSPIPLDHNSPGSTLAAWMPLPWAAPEVVVLPGFHTSAENSLKKNNAGNDLFMSITGLMATGARTVLISRWRPGGQSSIDLVREFLQELPHTSAADAWQRSLLLEWERELNPALEPRLIQTGIHVPPRGVHPLFWGAFLLADTGAPPKPSESVPVLPMPQAANAAPPNMAPGANNPAPVMPNNAAPAPAEAAPRAVLGNQDPMQRP
jgi:CHAT domain-containing protein